MRNSWQLGVVLGGLFATSACTVLGTVPTSTNISAVPAERPSVEVQAGFQPAFHLSDATQSDARGSLVPQGTAVFEPDRLLHVPGLIVGASALSGSPDQVDPYLGYRRYLDAAKDIAIALVGRGSMASATTNGATVKMSRATAEMIVDYDLSGRSTSAELHVLAGAAATALFASGSYCANADGWGVDCDKTSTPIAGRIDGAVFGLVRGGIALDILHGLHGPFHGARLETSFAAGTMPQLQGGKDIDRVVYASGTMSLTVALGGSK